MELVRGFEMTLSYIAHSVFRLLQLVLALTVCGLYGVDLSRAHQAGNYADRKWVFAEVTASLSAITALLYLIPFASRIPFAFIWDTILFIVWITLFGLFGSKYIKVKAEGDAGVLRMKNAVWVDLIDSILWLVSAAGMSVYWFSRGRKSTWTGRAIV